MGKRVVVLFCVCVVYSRWGAGAVTTSALGRFAFFGGGFLLIDLTVCKVRTGRDWRGGGDDGREPDGLWGALKEEKKEEARRNAKRRHAASLICVHVNVNECIPWSTPFPPSLPSLLASESNRSIHPGPRIGGMRLGPIRFDAAASHRSEMEFQRQAGIDLGAASTSTPDPTQHTPSIAERI